MDGKAGPSRRDFIKGAALAASGLVAGCADLPRTGGRSYSVAVLGDVHYDAQPIDTFHAAFRTAHQKDGMFARYRDEFENFAAMWGEPGRTRAIVEASGRCRTADTAFALQLGDLVEGDCESSEAHARMFQEAFAFMKRAYGADLPFVTVAGNHDVRQGGHRQGEYDNYCRLTSRWHEQELRVRVKGPNFAFRRGPDVWIVADFNRPDFTAVERLLDENVAERHTFFCTHGAVLTNGNRGPRQWFFLGLPQYDGKGGRLLGKALRAVQPEWTAARRRIRRMLAERNAIVLSGHSHLLELRDWCGDGGRITEIVMNSVTRTVKGSDVPGGPKVVGERPEDFGRCRVSPKAKPDVALDALYAEYAPGMRRYFTADAAGHMRLRVSDHAVLAEFYPLDAEKPARIFQVR